MWQNVIQKTVPRIAPMLSFERQCEEAVELYKKAFGAKILCLRRYADAPDDLPNKYNAAKDAELIYYAEIKIGGQRIMLCDNLFSDLPKGHTINLVVMYDTFDEAKTAYDIMIDGATNLIPLTADSLSCDFVDKYGIAWCIMVYHD